MEDAANKSAPVSLDGQIIHVGDQTVLELTLNALPGFWELRPLSWKAFNRHNVPLFMAQDIWRMCDINEKTLTIHIVHMLANSILLECK